MRVPCKKCGQQLDIKPYGEATEDSVRRLASDHASKEGCDWPANNITSLTVKFRKPEPPVGAVLTKPGVELKPIK